jgi:GNAT superfamily N-acetyltransferase
MADGPFTVPNCAVRFLTTADALIIQDLIERCADYAWLAAGQAPQPGDGEKLLIDRLPDKSLADKITLGFFDAADRLIGVLDAVRHYPEAGIWYVGLLMIDPDFRQRGLGASIVRAFEAWSIGLGTHAIRLGVYPQNDKAHRFWRRMGFVEIERHPQQFGVLDNIHITLQHDLRENL